METRLNDSIHRIYYMLKLNTFILLGIICGGCVLSSLTVGVSLHQAAKNESSLLTLKNWWQLFLKELSITAFASWMYNLCCFVLLWAIWFTSQFIGIVFLMAWIIQVALFVFTILSLFAEAHLRTYVEGNWVQILKLAWIQVFMTPQANMSTLLIWIVIIIAGSQVPAVAFFWGFGVWISLMTSLYRKEWIRLEII